MRKNHVGLRAAAVLWPLMASLAGCASVADRSSGAPAVRGPMDRKSLALAVVGNWSNPSALAARRLIEQYGAPDQIQSSRLVWVRNGPWKRTVVSDVTPAYVQTGREGVVVQTIDYALTAGQAADLASFAPDLVIDAAAGELSARSDREEANFLTLNLCDDIVRGRKTAAEARSAYASILERGAAGKSSRYTVGLLAAAR